MKRKNISNYHIIRLLFLLLAYPVCLNGNTFTSNNISNGYMLIVTLNFDSFPSDFNIYPARLKYNKDFAYSLTLDDGLSDAYQWAYFLLNGGYCNANQTNYSGLFYTDGCGNYIPFRAGISWFSVNSQGIDLHDGTSQGHMTWLQLSELYSNGWDIFNHGYSSVYNKPGINYDYEVAQNVEFVRNNTGIELTHFVIPSNDHNYINPAFSNGMKGIYAQFAEFRGYNTGIEVDSEFNPDNFRLYRNLINDDGFDTNNILDFLNNVDLNTNNGSNHIWCNEFTHSVDENSTGASLLFPLFSYYMEEIEKIYGRLGKDNMWMAPLQEVYEYLVIRDNVNIEWERDNNNVIVYLDFSDIPEYLKKNALTLVVESESNFTEPLFSRQIDNSYMGNGSNKIINIEWEQGVFNNVGDMMPWIKNKKNIEVFPNPASNYLIISTETELSNENIVFSLYNTQGEVVFKTSNTDIIDDKSFSIDIPGNLPDGVYYFILNSNNQYLGSERILLCR